MLQAVRGELDANDKVDFRKAVSTLGLNLSVCMIFGRHYGGKVMPKEIETLVLTFKKVPFRLLIHFQYPCVLQISEMSTEKQTFNKKKIRTALLSVSCWFWRLCDVFLD